MDQIQPINQNDQNQKKQVLQKLLSHVLGKTSSSVHETVNELNAAMGAFKNFSKEWDAIHGVTQKTNAPTGVPGPGVPPIGSMPPVSTPITPPAGPMPGNNMPSVAPGAPVIPAPNAGSNNITPPPPKPNPAPPVMSQDPKNGQLNIPGMPHPSTGQPQNAGMGGPGFIAGPPQQSSFNRPAPVSNLGIFGH